MYNHNKKLTPLAKTTGINKDKNRNFELSQLGYKILRFSNLDINSNFKEFAKPLIQLSKLYCADTQAAIASISRFTGTISILLSSILFANGTIAFLNPDITASFNLFSILFTG